MQTNLKDRFKEKLTELYGDFQPIVSKFGTASFGKISSDLCISSSQFSKLISGSATEGMYMRSIRNIDQLLEHKKILKDNKQLKKEISKNKSKVETSYFVKNKKLLLFGLIFISLFLGGILGTNFSKNETESARKEHPLEVFFNKQKDKASHIGFLNENEVQKYCPSSAYEGKWKLAKPYKIPLPGSKNSGVYLVAKSADITLVTAKYSSNKGRTLLGFEHLTHEIWLDIKRQPLIPTYFDVKTKTFNNLYNNLDFENNSDFVKIAVLKSFYIDEITIQQDSITRKGQPNGRYVEFENKELTKKYDINIERILHDVISNLTQTQCKDAYNAYCNPNDLKVNSTISFNCFYSIDLENLGFGGGYPYTKTMQLVEKNYSDNLICDCSE